MSITREALGRDARSGSAPLRIASVPSGHVYVRHLSPEGGGGGVERLRDPDPDDPRRSAEQRWWPPVMLRPEWAETADIDVFHVQFGFDTCTPDGLRELVGVLRRRGIPLVITVHDLRNPHHSDRREHDAQLDVLVPAADAVVTLTPAPPPRSRRRWGVEALVVPHPHVVDLAPPAPCGSARRTGPWTVGLHVKSLRASMDPLAVLADPGGAGRGRCPTRRLLVNGHRDVLDDGGRVATTSWRRTSGARSAAATSSCTSTTTSPTTSCGTTSRASTSRCCPTASAPTRAGSRPAATWAPPWWCPTAATSPTRGRSCPTRWARTATTPSRCVRRCARRARTRRRRPTSTHGARQRDEVAAAHLELYRRLLA